MNHLSRSILLASLACPVAVALQAQQPPTPAQKPSPLPPPAPQVPSSTPTASSFPNGVAPNRPIPHIAPKWETTINPGQEVVHYTAADKLLYSFHEQISPTVFIPATFSAGWESLVDADPHFGSDGPGLAERFGAAMLRQSTSRIFGDGIFAAAFHQDPRYYRVAHGSIKRRIFGSVEQTFVRRNDWQQNQFNWSGVVGHLATTGLEAAYYPDVSISAGIAAEDFATSFAGDATGKLFREFLPNLFSYLRRHH